MGPAELTQAIAIARQYYVEGQAKTEIADQHGLSRYKVARILDHARAAGLVQIRIHAGGAVDAELSERLRTHFRLTHALVVSGPFTDTPALRDALGRASAGLLAEVLGEHDVLGVAWGRTLDAMARHVGELPSCQIVQMTGVAGELQANSVNLMRELASVSPGPHYPIYAPLVVSDHHTIVALGRQTTIESATSRWPSISVAAVAVGSWDAEGSQVFDILAEKDRRELEQLGVVSEMCAIPFDRDGRPVASSLTERVMAIPYAELAAIPDVIAVAGGSTKITALRSVLRGHVVTSLVTDSSTATALLGEEPSTDRSRR